MTAQAVLAEAARRRVTLTPAGDRLRYRGPKAALTADFLEGLKALKAEILAALQPPPTPPPLHPEAPASPTTATPATRQQPESPCRVCGRRVWWLYTAVQISSGLR
jgi:hypothetical protein